MILILAVGVSACIALPVAAIAWAVMAVRRRRAQLREGARLDRNPATAVAIDSAGRPYEAVAVESCGGCGETLPADHRCTGAVAS